MRSHCLYKLSLIPFSSPGLLALRESRTGDCVLTNEHVFKKLSQVQIKNRKKIFVPLN